MAKYGERYYEMKTSTSFAGLNGFVWFVGVVENRIDPLKMGRLQVRIFGWHTENLQMIPTTDLPWCQTITPINSWNISKTAHEAEWVVGWFLDGESGQVPIIFGTVPAIPHIAADQSKGFSDPRTSDQLASSPNASLYPMNLDEPTTSRLYRNEDLQSTIVQIIKDNLKTGISTADGGNWSQPASSYAAVHPYNEVKETESGHVMEFDDTKGAERINLYHKSGTYTELRPDGSSVVLVKGINYTLLLQDDNVYIGGKYNITADGDMNLKSGGVLNLKIAADSNINIDGNLNATVGGSMTGTISGGVNLTSPTFDLNGNVNIVGNMNVIGNSMMDGTLETTGLMGSAVDVQVAGISLIDHTHSGVTSGPDDTGPPTI